jgi:hypothetical protein
MIIWSPGKHQSGYGDYHGIVVEEGSDKAAGSSISIIQGCTVDKA